MTLGGVVALPAPASHIQEWSLWLAAVVGGLTALGWVGHRVRRTWRRLRATWAAWTARYDALDALVTHELRPNSGSSMKDQLNRLEARQATMEGRQEEHLALSAEAQRVIEERLERVESVSETFAESQGHLWPAIEAVARSVPLDEPRYVARQERRTDVPDQE